MRLKGLIWLGPLCAVCLDPCDCCPVGAWAPTIDASQACIRFGASLSANPRVRISDAVRYTGDDTAVLIRAELSNVNGFEELSHFETMWFLDDFLVGGRPTGISTCAHFDLNSTRWDAALMHWAGTVEFRLGDVPGEALVADFTVEALMAPPGSIQEPTRVKRSLL